MTNNFFEMNHHKYDKIGHCIYCGATEDLRDEHIVPYGLGGNLILPKSSCGKCADITSRFELSVLRGSFWPARILRDIQSRRRHKNAPRFYPLSIEKNGKKESIELPLDDYPIVIPFPLFSVPGYLKPKGHGKGINLEGSASISFGPRPENVLKKIGAEQISFKPKTDKPVDFARLIAKIAFSMASAVGALAKIKNKVSPVVPAILGEAGNIGRWVGTITAPSSKHPDHLHRILIKKDEQRGILIGDVQLFSDSQTPRYGVILGEL